MKRRNLVILLAAATAGAAGAGFLGSGVLAGDPPATTTAATGPGKAAWHRTDADIKVYKTATCGCCTAWVDHLRNSGFSVEAVDVEQQALNDMKRSVGLTRDLAACHTAFIDGYVVEGHVPASDIRRLTEREPDGVGISVPGMPMGSPGMEYGGQEQPYQTLLFASGGEARVFASHNQ